ncbi:hypothetical protein N7468_006009 [Penicillium chermesinum]|uniref:DUF2415 domain-containing protein n=1 Tax=Penicillium chermesinum TaxID=63820 RepID=A0A9W9P2Y9_9EURO|nr:uncharacterized protein N7468_006009 [Penicillium chermesinum]KAJ5233053.1 hypothetical protein N7468_006009 [Penicillium chermesinum]
MALDSIFHPQLRHYISTADPDRIYVVIERTIYVIHISLQKKESIATIPFEPRCLAAGFGWIAVGGPDNGECAYLKINETELQVRDDFSPFNSSDVDSALPIDLDIPSRLSSPASANDGPSFRYRPRRRLAELALHKIGSNIVNSVTIHRFPAKGENGLHEDVLILSNNDKSVTIYSLTRSKVLTLIQHPYAMNYATISPDQTILAAVGDENRAYFYAISRNWESTVTTDASGNLPDWEWELLRCVEMDIGSRVDDACCFTIAFSPSGHLCAIGSQSGVVTVLDVELIHQTADNVDLADPVIYQFSSTRSHAEGGAVRCLTFSPEPWDLLVWLEGHGRAGVADVRQGFLRRQVLQLDLDDPSLQDTHLDILPESADMSFLEDLNSPDTGTPRRYHQGNDHLAGRGDDPRHPSLRENLIQDLTERERLIMEFLNTARWTTRLEDGLTERPERPARAPPPHNLPPRTRHRESEDGSPASPPLTLDPAEAIQDEQSGRPASGTPTRQWHARRQSSVILSQESRPSEAGASSYDRQPSVYLNWTMSPSELQSTASDNPTRASTAARSNRPFSPALDLGISPEALARLRSQRSDSTPRRADRAPVTERRFDTARLSSHEVRASLIAERHRRQRQLPSETYGRTASERDHRQRQHDLFFEQTHSPRWIRNIINDLPDRSMMHASGTRAEEPDATAGVGWGADGRTLYIATLEGIFEFQLNIHDRKTFPVFSYR